MFTDKGGEEGLPGGRAYSTTVGDLNRVFQGFRKIGKQSRHLSACFKTMMGGYRPSSMRIIKAASFRKSQEDIMSLIIVGSRETHIIGGHNRNGVVIGQI